MTALTIGLVGSADSGFPRFDVSIVPGQNYDPQGRLIIVAYRRHGDETWVVDGIAFTDADGNASIELLVALADGEWDIRAQAKDPENPAEDPISGTLLFTVNRAPEAPVMPPSLDEWAEESVNGRFGYLACMVIGTEPKLGEDLGRILPINNPKPAVIYSLSGEGSAGVTIDVDTGMIEVIDQEAFATPGVRKLTITASNAAGESSVTVPFRVVERQDRHWFVDATSGSDDNDGQTPSRAFKTVDQAGWARRNDWGDRATIYLKRGGVYISSTGIRIHSGTTWTAYGDPAEAQPHVVVEGSVGVYQDKREVNFRIEDIHLSAAVRCFEGRDADRLTLLRAKFSGSTSDAENGGAVYAHGYSNFRMLHCDVADGISGDGVYLRKLGLADRTSVNRILYCSFGVPRGGSSDNLQITSERKDGMECYDVEVAHCTFKQDDSTDSTKGNLVIEGCNGFLVQQNRFSGRYFCASILSDCGTVRDNWLAFANLDKNSFALGSGGQRHTRQQRWLLNTLVASTWGMSLSGFKDPDGGWQRIDYEIHLNTFRGNTGMMKIDRPMSGAVRFNVAEFNGDATITRRAAGRTIAEGDVYTNYIGQPNWFNTAVGPAVAASPTLTGDLMFGKTVRVEVPVIEGTETSVIWLINDQPVSEPGSSELVVPVVIDNLWMPAFAKAPTLGASIIYTDTDGNRTIVPVRLPDGSTAGVLASAS